MKEESYKYPEKIPHMPPGEWDSEPDKLQFTDPETGMPCLVVRNGCGALCGYVGVPEGHPYFDKHYRGIDVDVHGGLTFSDFCQEEGGKICHKVEPGENDRVWWLGFDCAHLGDLIPQIWGITRRRTCDSDTYKNLSYVKSECAKLAAQLKAIGELCPQSQKSLTQKQT